MPTYDTEARPEVGEAIRARRDVIVRRAADAVADDPRMVEMAQQRSQDSPEMSADAVVHYVETMATDISLGTDAAIRRGLEWSIGFSDGHGLDFSSELYHTLWDAVSGAALDVLEGDDAHSAVREYGDHVKRLVDEMIGEGS